jgi:hypothetical protein
MEVESMAVDRRTRLVSAAALLAPALGLGGRFLAPTLLGVQPWLLLAMSPSDPHLLLARADPRVLAVVLVFVMRVGRAWVVYAACCQRFSRVRAVGRLRRLLLPERPIARTRRAALGAVVVLPGMAGAVVAARSQLRHLEFVITMVASTAAGLAITLLAASRFDAQIRAIGQVITTHPLEATGAVIAVLGIGRFRTHRRARRQEVPVDDLPRSEAPADESSLGSTAAEWVT